MSRQRQPKPTGDPVTAPPDAPPLPVLIATSVVRGSEQGESHGGVYLVDLESERVVQTVDWNTTSIDFSGRGWDRGLRGIAFDRDEVYIAASDELFVYDPAFRELRSYRNPYLRHCHEIAIHDRLLVATSTGYDSLLVFDLDMQEFIRGLYIAPAERGLECTVFDPQGRRGPGPVNRLHINNVHLQNDGLYFSGLHTGGLWQYANDRLHLAVTLPGGVHNAQWFADGVAFNDTRANAVRYVGRSASVAFPVPRIRDEHVRMPVADASGIARQRFGRGLCAISDRTLAGGSSPSTIALHDIVCRDTFRAVNLSLDLRNAIHGLEVWPFGMPPPR